MQPDNNTITPQTVNNRFDAYYAAGVSVFSEVHGTLSVTNDSISMVDDQQKILFNLPKSSVSTINDGLSQIAIVTNDNKKYNVLFRDAKKGFFKALSFGMVFGGGGKNGVFGAPPQQRGKLVMDCLNQYGYNAPYNKHRPSSNPT
jgi:hypothetical protein